MGCGRSREVDENTATVNTIEPTLTDLAAKIKIDPSEPDMKWQAGLPRSGQSMRLREKRKVSCFKDRRANYLHLLRSMTLSVINQKIERLEADTNVHTVTVIVVNESTAMIVHTQSKETEMVSLCIEGIDEKLVLLQAAEIALENGQLRARNKHIHVFLNGKTARAVVLMLPQKQTHTFHAIE
jgi:hypothetical protein